MAYNTAVLVVRKITLDEKENKFLLQQYNFTNSISGISLTDHISYSLLLQTKYQFEKTVIFLKVKS